VSTDQTPKPFDLVELTDAHSGYPTGSRGTVVVEGFAQALVDMNWADDHRSSSSTGVRTIPFSHLKVVRKRPSLLAPRLAGEGGWASDND
jgi:hypothetical protein